MERVTATEAGRRLSDVLDAVEHRHESFLITRNGRPVARLDPVSAASGALFKSILRRHAPDPDWPGDLVGIRSMLTVEERGWRG